MRRFAPTRPTPLSADQVVGKTLEIGTAVRTARSSLIWGIINATMCLFVFYDFIYTCPWYSSTFRNIEGLFAAFLAACAIFHFYRYIKNAFWIDPIVLNLQQKKLIGIKDLDQYIKLTSTPKASENSAPFPTSPLTPMNMSNSSWRSSVTPSLNESVSPNYTMSSPSWVYRQGSPDMTLPPTPSSSVRHRLSFGSPNTSMLSNASSCGLIEDEQSLSEYLKEFDNREKKAVVSLSMEQPSNLLSSFWSHPASRTTDEMTPMLRRCTYQMAPPTPPQTSSTPGGGVVDDPASPSSSLHQNQDLWRRFGVNPDKLTQWNANLRMWISQTVLKRLVDEIATVDEALLRHGLADVRVGAVGLERLRKTAQIAQLAHNIPTLPCLIPFLEVTPHQEYLVGRLKDLVKGGCMSEYRWNGGGNFHGKAWEENLPTDSTIVMHMLATYLDSQLPPLTKNPDVRPFSSQYFVKTPEKPDKEQGRLAIFQTQTSPPYFCVVFKQETLRVPRGQSNLFQAILLFINIVKAEESGMLGRVNLGPSGINMLWVIDGK